MASICFKVSISIRNIDENPMTVARNTHSCSLRIRFNRVTNQVRHEITKPRVANAMSSGYLVGGLEHFLFFHILGIVTPTHYFFSEGLKPPTRI